MLKKGDTVQYVNEGAAASDHIGTFGKVLEVRDERAEPRVDVKFAWGDVSGPQAWFKKWVPEGPVELGLRSTWNTLREETVHDHANEHHPVCYGCGYRFPATDEIKEGDTVEFVE